MPFKEKIYPAKARGMVEKWLIQVEEMMSTSIRYVIKDATIAYAKTPRKRWVVEWPGQVVICASQIYWTKDTETAIQNNKQKYYLDLCSSQINDIVALVRGKLDNGPRIACDALIVIDLHGS